ncbi:uncharacterized protein LOC127130138 [Lathyrus oleraceus]|uniref:uncharacterized protein LOC127130138 n=1 Tax=Pisum sativum TaxID=3888 RepID=UPI0021D24AEE|nr:uncharacterized protein LOC127130138 [Pisum sativum]
MEDYQPMRFDFSDEDIMFVRDWGVLETESGPEPGSRLTVVFDGASNAQGNGIGEIITYLTRFHLPFTARLCFDCTNNMAEYEACIFGLEAVVDLKIKILEVYGDSALVISQIIGDWEFRDPKLVPYKEHSSKLIPYFDEVTFRHIPRAKNQLTNALDTLASMLKVKWKNEAPSFHIDYLDEPAYYLAAEEESNGHHWFHDIKKYLEKQEYPEDAYIKDKKYLQKLSDKFFLSGDVLYKRNYDSVLLRCVDRHEAD